MPLAWDGLQGSQCLAGDGAGCWPLCHYLSGRQEWRQEMRKGKAGVLQGQNLARKAWGTRTSMSTPGITLGKTHNCTLCVSGISRLCLTEWAWVEAMVYKVRGRMCLWIVTKLFQHRWSELLWCFEVIIGQGSIFRVVVVTDGAFWNPSLLSPGMTL